MKYQFLVYDKDKSLDNILIRIDENKNIEFFDYDGIWKNGQNLPLQVLKNSRMITEEEFTKIKNSKFKFYFCKKSVPFLLLRIINDLYIQVYDLNKLEWKKINNLNWLVDILNDGDPDFVEIPLIDAFNYINSLEKQKKKTR